MGSQARRMVSLTYPMEERKKADLKGYNSISLIMSVCNFVAVKRAEKVLNTQKRPSKDDPHKKNNFFFLSFRLSMMPKK